MRQPRFFSGPSEAIGYLTAAHMVVLPRQAVPILR